MSATRLEMWRGSPFRVRAVAAARVLQPPERLVLGMLGCVALALANHLPNLLPWPATWTGLISAANALALLLAFALFSAALWRPLPRWLIRTARLLAYPALLWAAFASAQTVRDVAHTLPTVVSVTRPHYATDDMYDNQYNALLVLHGVNPYVGDHMAASMAYFHIAGYTPLARGTFADPLYPPTGAEMRVVLNQYLAHPQSPPVEIDPRTAHSYPAGAFLVDVPFVWLGLPGMGVIQLLLLAGALLALVVLAPPSWRIGLALLLLCNTDLVHRALLADFDVWWIVPLAAAWLVGAGRLRGAVLVGLACAVKQTAWLLAPFYLIWTWRTRGWQAAMRSLAATLATFLMVNLPWAAASPGAWLSSLFLPVSEPLLPRGSGFVNLALVGAMPLPPSWVFSLIEVGTLVALLAWYAWAGWQRCPYAGLFFGITPLVFAWRSDARYFLPVALLAATALVATARERRGTAQDGTARDRESMEQRSVVA